MLIRSETLATAARCGRLLLGVAAFLLVSSPIAAQELRYNIRLNPAAKGQMLAVDVYGSGFRAKEATLDAHLPNWGGWPDLGPSLCFAQGCFLRQSCRANQLHQFWHRDYTVAILNQNKERIEDLGRKGPSRLSFQSIRSVTSTRKEPNE